MPANVWLAPTMTIHLSIFPNQGIFSIIDKMTIYDVRQICWKSLLGGQYPWVKIHVCKSYLHHLSKFEFNVDSNGLVLLLQYGETSFPCTEISNTVPCFSSQIFVMADRWLVPDLRRVNNIRNIYWTFYEHKKCTLFSRARQYCH